MAAKVVSFINLKGGVGKTTLALAIAEFRAFGGVGQKVLLIDMDAQYNLSSALLPNDKLEEMWEQEKSTYHMFKAALEGKQWDIEQAIITDCSNIPGNTKLHTIVCNPGLGQLDEVILDLWQKDSAQLNVILDLWQKKELGQLDEVILDLWQQGATLKVDLRPLLGQHLQKVKDRYDWIIIDCPPSLSISTSNAILCSDYWICPLIPEALSLLGIDMIQQRIASLKGNPKYGGSVNIEFAGSILNKVDLRRKDHIREAVNVYNSYSRFQPFDCWVGDWKPLYIVSDYDYPTREYQEGRRNRPEWWNVEEKYGYHNMAQNNTSLLLQRKLVLRTSYYIRDVIHILAREFTSRLP